jgi:hypothetical protein
MITKFNIFEGTIHAEIDPYEEEIWDESKHILISDLKVNDELKCRFNAGELKTKYKYQVSKVMKDCILIMSETGDTFILDEKYLNEYFELVIPEIC